jgi:hypothetical protein
MKLTIVNGLSIQHWIFKSEKKGIFGKNKIEISTVKTRINLLMQTGIEQKWRRRQKIQHLYKNNDKE